jgi:hypothetical protein
MLWTPAQARTRPRGPAAQMKLAFQPNRLEQFRSKFWQNIQMNLWLEMYALKLAYIVLLKKRNITVHLIIWSAQIPVFVLNRTRSDVWFYFLENTPNTAKSPLVFSQSPVHTYVCTYMYLHTHMCMQMYLWKAVSVFKKIRNTFMDKHIATAVKDILFKVFIRFCGNTYWITI